MGELCSADEKAQIEALKQKGDAALAEMVKDNKEKVAKMKGDFEKFVEGLQAQYEEADQKLKADTKALNTKDIKFAKQIVGEPEPEEKEGEEEEEEEEEEEGKEGEDEEEEEEEEEEGEDDEEEGEDDEEEGEDDEE